LTPERSPTALWPNGRILVIIIIIIIIIIITLSNALDAWEGAWLWSYGAVQSILVGCSKKKGERSPWLTQRSD